MSIFRRIMLGGDNIASIPGTRKLYYKATAKVSPASGSLGSPIIFNNWDSATGEGIIVCSEDILIIGESAFSDNMSLISITIPDGVTELGGWAFAGCDNLISIAIPESIIKIKFSAFNGCKNLTSVTIPDGITEIEWAAFTNCESLTSVTISNNVTNIGDAAFNCCYNLTSVYCKAATPPALGGTGVFDYNGSGRKIYVPYESVNAYKSATYWKEYDNAIEGYEF